MSYTIGGLSVVKSSLETEKPLAALVGQGMAVWNPLKWDAKNKLGKKTRTTSSCVIIMWGGVRVYLCFDEMKHCTKMSREEESTSR